MSCAGRHAGICAAALIALILCGCNPGPEPRAQGQEQIRDDIDHMDRVSPKSSWERPREPPPSMPHAIDRDKRLGHAIEDLLREHGIDVQVPDQILPEGGGTINLEGREITYIVVQPLGLHAAGRPTQGQLMLIDDTDPGESVWDLVTFTPERVRDVKALE